MDNCHAQYIDQSAYNLILNVVEGELDKDQFSLLTNKKIVMPNFQIKASIIGASHLITFRSKGFVFHEIFACTDIKTKSRLAYCGPLRKVLGQQCLSFGNSIKYQFDVKLLKWDIGQQELNHLESLVNSERRNQKSNCISSEFCFPCKDGTVVPKTIIMVKASEKEVLIKTLHSYPNEGNLVFTETKIDI